MDAIKELGVLDNTLFIYIVGDNGASGEGTPYGVLNEMSVLNGVPEDPSVVLKHLDELGGPTCLQPLPCGVRLGMRHAFPVDETGGFSLWRHSQCYGDQLAETH